MGTCYIDESDGRLATERRPRRTPIYSIVSESSPRRSIVLGPLPPEARSPEINTSGNSVPLIPSMKSHKQLYLNNGADYLNKKRKHPEKNHNRPCSQIRLAIRLDGAEISASSWVDWIRNIPGEGRAVHVEGK